MNTSKLKLASVKLVNGGMKGIEVDYLNPSIKGNVQFIDTYKSKRKAPIHEELEKCFSWLRPYLLDICGYTLEKEEREYLMNALEMTGVKYTDKGAILMGELAILGGNKTLKLETPLISDEIDFPEYGKMIAIIEGVYSETKEYLEGKKTLSDTQLVLKFNSKNDEFDVESFKRMTKEEQRDLATKILEDQGHVVLHNDEIVSEESEVVDATSGYVQKEEEVVAPQPEVTFTTTATPEQKPEVVTLKEEEDFRLPLAKKPVKVPAAKKKVA